MDGYHRMLRSMTLCPAFALLLVLHTVMCSGVFEYRNQLGSPAAMIRHLFRQLAASMGGYHRMMLTPAQGQPLRCQRIHGWLV